MNCPNCGIPLSIDQQFCRACGHALEAAPTRGSNFGRIATVSLSAVFIGALAVLSGKNFDIAWMSFGGTILALAGLFVMMIAALRREVRSRKPLPIPANIQPTIESAGTTNKLLPFAADDFIRDVPSVTENTTELLKQPRQIRR